MGSSSLKLSTLLPSSFLCVAYASVAVIRATGGLSRLLINFVKCLISAHFLYVELNIFDEIIHPISRELGS